MAKRKKSNDDGEFFQMLKIIYETAMSSKEFNLKPTDKSEEKYFIASLKEKMIDELVMLSCKENIEKLISLNIVKVCPGEYSVYPGNDFTIKLIREINEGK